MVLAVVGCKGEATRDLARRPAAEPAAAPQVTRMIIRTANVSIIVADTAASLEKITRAAESAGGYVSDSRVWRERELLRGTLSLRVPAAQLSSTLAAIRQLAIRVQSESISGEEVTREYVDLEATETELRELMRVMREMTALATLQVELVPDAIAKPVVEPGWQPLVVAKDAGRALVKAMQGVTNVAIWLLIYIVPIVLMIVVVALLVRRAITLAWKTRDSSSL